MAFPGRSLPSMLERYWYRSSISPVCILRLTVVVGQLARGPNVQDIKGPVCACVGGDDGQGPVSHQAVDLDGAPASTPAFNCPALYSAADFWAGAGPERERGRAVCCDRHVRRLPHRRMQARRMQRHEHSMQMRLRVKAFFCGTDPRRTVDQLYESRRSELDTCVSRTQVHRRLMRNPARHAP